MRRQARWTGILWLAATAWLPAADIPAGQRVEIRTSLGSIVVELDPVSSPRNCRAFLSYIDQQVYRGSAFDQKEEGDIQGGKPGPLAKGFSKSGNFVPFPATGEFLLKHVRGAVGMARTVGDCNPMQLSNSTQFYIMRRDVPADDGEYSIFGHVVRGMDLVDRIADSLEKATPVGFDVVFLQPAAPSTARNAPAPRAP